MSEPDPPTSEDARDRRARRWRGRLFVVRQTCAAIVFLVLAAGIAGYWHFTRPDRVRAIAEAYLTELAGGPVTVGGAAAGVFDGLRLDDVEVRVDGQNRPDSLLFTARSFQLSVDPRALLEGELRATRIVVVDPHARLVEDLSAGRTGDPDRSRWNFQRMDPRPLGGGSGPGPSELPEVIVRNARVDYAAVADDGDRPVPAGSVSIEGQLVPGLGPGRYGFRVQTRGRPVGTGPGGVPLASLVSDEDGGAEGPSVEGAVSLPDERVAASMRGLRIGRDVLAMLPAEVRTVFDRYQVTGALDVPTFAAERRPDGSAGFRVEVALSDGAVALPPETWLGAAEVEALRAAGKLVPVRLTGVSGRATFTEKDAEVTDLVGGVDGVRLAVDARADGYSLDAPAVLTVRSVDGGALVLPKNPPWVDVLPGPVREVYDRFSPTGRARVSITVAKPAPGPDGVAPRPTVRGRVDILDGSFAFDQVPYPVRRATGSLVFGPDPGGAGDELLIRDLRGRGLAGGPNADATVGVEGRIYPLDRYAGFDVTVVGRGLRDEPALIESLPDNVRQAIGQFDADGAGEYPTFEADLRVRVSRPPGPDQLWSFATELALRDAAGKFAGFPYPLEGVSARLRLGNRDAEVLRLVGRNGDARVELTGRVHWGDPQAGSGEPGLADLLPPGTDTPRPHGSVRPYLSVAATGVPIDGDLLAALPPDARAAIDRAGVGGTIAVTGTVTPGRAGAAGSPVDYDLSLALTGGTWRPDGGAFAVEDVAGTVGVTPSGLTLTGLTGTRDGATLRADGRIDLAAPGGPVLTVAAKFRQLLADRPLYDFLPVTARLAWDDVRPEGRTDGELNLTLPLAPATAGTAAAPTDWSLALRPQGMTATPAALPLKLDDVRGTVIADATRVAFAGVTATHAGAPVTLDGTGTVAPDGTQTWDLRPTARGLAMTPAVRAALPPGLADLLASLDFAGPLSADFAKLVVTVPPTPDAAPDVDADVTLSTAGASLDVGLAATDVTATVELAGSWRGGEVQRLDGTVVAPSLVVAGRPATDLHATLTKPPDRRVLKIDDLRAGVAGGDLAGRAELRLPDAVAPGASPDAATAGRYAVAFVVRGADVKTLTGESPAPSPKSPASPDAAALDQAIDGKLTASLSLEGTYGDPASRRGRGDVLVEGESLYRIPFLLGVTQIANLSLPIDAPFQEATSRYAVDGQRVAFESIDLRARGMTMSGAGRLDFATGGVSLTFTTDNPDFPTLPVIGDLLRGARQELLKVHVRGTLQRPEVSVGSLETVTTTVDEVLRGD